ncbi:NIPSNAP family protein [Pseudonocardia sp. RS010]|uniref:NIPSNAP family protein n=1 Tax=Pseudonocardia sp. RS010 TaxID=3385979 RepID=UPI0039A035AC
MTIYELREYSAVPGRLPALVERFNSATCRIFRKHGMELVFLSRTDVGDDSKNEIVYVLRFDSYDDLQSKWAAFFADPEWKTVAARSEEAGPLVARVRRRLLTTADFPGVESGPTG